MGQQAERSKAKKPVKGLSPVAAQVLRARSVTGRLRLTKLLKVLKELARFDEVAEVLRARTTKWAIVSGVGLLGLIVGLFILGGGTGSGIVFSLVAGAAFVAAALFVYFLVRRKRLRDIDLPDDFRTVLIPFLMAVREDIVPTDKVKLRLDLAGPRPNKVLREGKLPRRAGKETQETVYSDPWCHLEATLVAGNRITLDIANTYTRRDVRWKNARGKSKRKLKWKKLVVARATLVPDAQRSAFDRSAVECRRGEMAVTFKERDRSESAALKAKCKFASTGASPPAESIHPKELIEMFLRLSSLVRPLSTGSEHA